MNSIRFASFCTFLSVLLSVSWAAGDPEPGSTPARVSALEESVAGLAAAMDEVLPNTVPAGAIVPWSGPPGVVPKGWVLCDGEGGTPDLHDRFIMGAAGAEDMGEQGWDAEHEHLVQPHRHELPVPHHTHEIPGVTQITTGEAGEHTHELGDSTAGIEVDSIAIGNISVANHPHSHVVRIAGLHGHQLEIPNHRTGVGEGTGETSYDESTLDGKEHLPPYYRLAFIVKLPDGAPTDPPYEDPSFGASPQHRLDALEERVALLSSTLDAARPYQVPPRLIVTWSGSADRLPSGWALCDGENGTPDLRGRFVMGTMGDEDLGEQGGSPEHAHDVRAHQHSVAMPSHAHEIAARVAGTDGIGDHTHEVLQTGYGDMISDRPADHMAASMSHTHPIAGAGEHSHEVAIPSRSTTEADGSGHTSLAASTLDPASNVPPYYKLAFIMKLRMASPSPDAPPASQPPTLPERIDALAETVAALSSALYAALPFFVPPEVIAVWPESPTTPPRGWVVCDGENGTPDLRGTFVMGAVVGADERGGFETHGHTMDAHDHDARFPHAHGSAPVLVRTTTERPDETGHGHRTQAATVLGGDPKFPSVMVPSSEHGHFRYFDDSTIHEHDLVLDEAVDPVGSELVAETTEGISVVVPAEHLPPYSKAVFVLKLSEEAP